MAGTDSSVTLVQQIARNVLNIAEAAIPPEVIEHTKELILDSIGCALAASDEPRLRARRGSLRNSAATRTVP